MENVLSLIHPYWIDRYSLDKAKGEVLTIPAEELLLPGRFDLFAKLFYIRHREDMPSLARRVYLENLRSFVPSGKEYGKEKEKSSFREHIAVFNTMIDDLSNSGFDSAKSIVPVGCNNIILDGAHRVSALSWYGKNVSVCRFSGVLGDYYDYSWFLSRSTSRYTADLAALEGLKWLRGVKLLCLWDAGNESLPDDLKLFYERGFRVGWSSYVRLRSLIEPEWKPFKADGSRKVQVRFVFLFGSEDGSVIDNEEKMREVAGIVLSRQGRSMWYRGGKVGVWLEILLDRLRTNCRFMLNVLRDRLKDSDNKYWIGFYKLVSPVWKIMEHN